MAGKRGVRLTKRQTDNCRAAIQTTMLVNRLQDHIQGETELNTSQVRAIEILLNKSLPNLQATEIDATVHDSTPDTISTAELVAIAGGKKQ